MKNGNTIFNRVKNLRLMPLVIFSLFAFRFSLASAQDVPTVTARFDRDSVVIGDQFHIEVRVEKDMMQMVDFPRLVGAQMAPNVEFMAEFPADTIASDGRRQTIGKRYLVTIWEGGDYNLGLVPVLYLDKNVVDTLFAADSLRIKVGSFDIDTTVDQPVDIKPLRGIPLRFGEIGGWFAICVGVLAVVLLGAWFLTKYRHRIPLLGGERPKTPPHIEAIRRLEALQNQKLPQNGKHKQYWSGITDILREYVEGRFGIGAMEMTSEETLAALDAPRREGLVDETRYRNLGGLLRTADLVKFAKFTPDDAENEAAWYDAYYFVEETKEIKEEDEK
ncbi:MAG: hypothetical protein LBV18_06500 [Alistipes sp.]|nr:hypothetical protein [Alistipes sp.]